MKPQSSDLCSCATLRYRILNRAIDYNRQSSSRAGELCLFHLFHLFHPFLPVLKSKPRHSNAIQAARGSLMLVLIQSR